MDTLTDLGRNWVLSTIKHLFDDSVSLIPVTGDSRDNHVRVQLDLSPELFGVSVGTSVPDLNPFWITEIKFESWCRLLHRTEEP